MVHVALPTFIVLQLQMPKWQHVAVQVSKRPTPLLRCISNNLTEQQTRNVAAVLKVALNVPIQAGIYGKV